MKKKKHKHKNKKNYNVREIVEDNYYKVGKNSNK